MAYAKSRPEFNLLHNNCARFACAMLASCGPAPVAATDQCSPDACAESLMFGGPTGEPGCGMRRAKRATPGAGDQSAGATAFGGGAAAALRAGWGAPPLHRVPPAWANPMANPATALWARTPQFV